MRHWREGGQLSEAEDQGDFGRVASYFTPTEAFTIKSVLEMTAAFASGVDRTTICHD
jgi:hypothetical protein